MEPNTVKSNGVEGAVVTLLTLTPTKPAEGKDAKLAPAEASCATT